MWTRVFCWARAELIGAAKVCKLGGVAGTSTRWIMIATHTCSKVNHEVDIYLFRARLSGTLNKRTESLLLAHNSRKGETH